MDRKIAHLATELADACVLDTAASCGPGVGIEYELAELRAARAVAYAALDAAFSRYKDGILRRDEVSREA